MVLKLVSFRAYMWHNYPPVKSVRAAASCCLVIMLFSSGSLAGRFQDLPASRISIAELDALEREGKIFELREKVQAAAEAEPQDSAVLGHLARISDAFGDHSGEAYERWTDALRRTGASPSGVVQALERGVVVALRDGEVERARRMSALLGPNSRFSQLLPERAAAIPEGSGLSIPGGTATLAEIAQVDPSAPASRFMAEYARAILRRNNIGEQERRLFEDRLKRYFDVMRTLVAYGRADSEQTEIRLDTANPTGIDRTEKILAVLGWQLRRLPKGGLLIELAPGAENGERQQFGSAAGIDEADMKLTLESGKPFVLRLRHERVPVLIDLPFWEKLAAKKGVPARGLLEEMIYNPRVTGLYVALSSMNEETRRAILNVTPSEELLDRTKQLSFYGASISIENGRLLLPGGAEAIDAWTKLVEADPSQIRAFLKNLERKDGGKLFAYYHALAVLPLPNQRFFTRNASRLARFYKVFPFSDEKSLDGGLFVKKDDQFARLAREIPLDAKGNVRFPGSERVWMVAKEGSENLDDLQNLLQSARNLRTPDAEDEILLDLLEREYDNEMHRKFRLIQNFLAVVRIEAHRRQPMDETMALVLAQNYAKYEAVYAYFAELPELTGQQATSFFRAARVLEGFKGAELETALGEFDSLLKLISLLQGTGALSEPKSAELFGMVCLNFARIKAPSQVPSVAFDSVEGILREIRRGSEEDADERLANAFAGQEMPRQFAYRGAIRSVNPGDANKRRMREVLRLQAIVPLESLLRTYRAALQLTRGIDAQSLTQIEANLGSIVEIVPTAAEKLPNDFAESILIGRPSELASVTRKLKKQLEEKEPSTKNVSRLANELIGELHPFLKTTLTGWIYAYYLSPADLAVASNRYFVRSHVFNEPTVKDYWPKVRLQPSPAGLRLLGGFAQVGATFGAVAATAVDSSDSISQNHAATFQLGAIRSIPWHVVDGRSIHLTALRIRLGREFIVQAAFSEPLRNLLAGVTVGVVGPARRYDLLNAVSARDVSHALSLLTATDFFVLADSLIRGPGDKGNSSSLLSAYASEVRVVPENQMNYFGGIHTETAGCTHPHLFTSPSYEEYADNFSPTPLAERMSGILLEVVESADRLALPIEAFGLMSEDVVRQYFKQTRSTPREDWLSAVQAMRTLDLSTLDGALENR